MKLKYVVAACATALLLVGCGTANTVQVREDGVGAVATYPEYVKDVRRKTNDNGMLEVQIIFQSDKTRSISYKIEWLDQDGFVLRNPIDERYRELTLTRHEEYVMSKLASDKRARNIKIYTIK